MEVDRYISVPPFDSGGRELVETRRRAAGLSQEELADKVGIHNRSYQNYISGERDPSITTWYKICREVGLVSDRAEAFNSTSDSYAITLPMTHDSNRNSVVQDQRDAEKIYGDRLDSIAIMEVRASTMEGILSKGAHVEYDTDSGYVGPDMYLIRLVDGERPFPAYVRQLAPDEIEIEFMNRDEPIRLEREGEKWVNERGHAVQFEIVGVCEQWAQRTVDMSS
jgi:DNA-binding XRE family transcriptional regulator